MKVSPYGITRMSLEITAAFEKAMRFMEEGQDHVFITGKAGTGKSTLLRHFRAHTKKNIVILAPTGVAAVNIGGQTIHSFFKFTPSTTMDTVRRYQGNPAQNIYKKIDALVIDEISMVRADLLDCVDKSMRLNGPDPKLPFGGVQLIFFGDMYQLPPVVPAIEREIFESYYKSPYFFSARVFRDVALEVIELDKIYRQNDPQFIDLLNAIRNDQCTPHNLKTLNARVDRNFRLTPDSPYICLTPRNNSAEQVNELMLAMLNTPKHLFEAQIKGSFGKEYYPAPAVLCLKEGARVMMVNNDANKRWVNGTMANILKVLSAGDQTEIVVQLDNGNIHQVKPYTWEVSKFVIENNRIGSATMGQFKQFPMILAWATTIHKSQGKTFDKVLLDLGYRGAFSPGQVYVALSRCTSLDGIILTHAVEPRSIWVDQAIAQFIPA
jgi:ATP-dependent exoDNAse (exonuclease V) alpha subunit